MTANERFKRRYTEAYGISLVLASAVTLLTFVYFPQLTSGDVSFSVEELQAVELPPEVVIPPAPQAIARPATPVVGSANINEDITIAPTTFEENPVSNLPPPPTTAAAGGEMKADIAKAPVFTPFTVPPRLLNTGAIQEALERSYPPLLREAGIGGDVLVWFFIDEDGVVVTTELKKSSGYPPLDEAALKIAPLMRFTPAKNRDKKVKVWVSLPITFNTR
ncbi:MAG: TonB family protein [Gemmatimonadota bacterium]|jgi:protein TonB